jgi:hypothetical protein
VGILGNKLQSDNQDSLSTITANKDRPRSIILLDRNKKVQSATANPRRLSKAPKLPGTSERIVTYPVQLSPRKGDRPSPREERQKHRRDHPSPKRDERTPRKLAGVEVDYKIRSNTKIPTGRLKNLNKVLKYEPVVRD